MPNHPTFGKDIEKLNAFPAQRALSYHSYPRTLPAISILSGEEGLVGTFRSIQMRGSWHEGDGVRDERT